MALASDTRFLVLHGLRLKGFGEPPAIAAAVGLDEATVVEHLGALKDAELVLRRDGRLSGFALTPAGRAEQERLAGADLTATGALDDIKSTYVSFLALNDHFKILCTDWQLRDGELYDHADATYNEAIFARLGYLHDELAVLLAALATHLDRYAVYGPRFADAMARLIAGELEFLTKPLIDSYHTIWFELHEDLLTGLGIDRSQEGSF
jgi:DNA-binding MarR family transcriptional regulator